MNPQCSRSDVQQNIEKDLIKAMEDRLHLESLANDAYLEFTGDQSSKIRPDMFSERHRIIGEVYSHIGKLKPSQKDKIASDILKMILFEKDSECIYDKYIIVCDEAVKKCMLGNAIIRNAVRIYNIKIECINLDPESIVKLKETMKRQNFYTGE